MENSTYSDILLVLKNTQSPDYKTRVSAETSLKDFLLSREDAIHTLLKFSTNPSNPVHLRQLTLVLVCQQLNPIWSKLGPPKQRLAIDLTMESLQSSESVIRNSSMVALAKIVANAKAPEQEYLLSILQMHLQNKDNATMTICSRCVAVITEDADYFRQINILKALYGTLHTIFIKTDIRNIKLLHYITKSLRFSIFKIGDYFLNVDDSEINKEDSNFVYEVITSWTNVIIEWIMNYLLYLNIPTTEQVAQNLPSSPTTSHSNSMFNIEHIQYHIGILLELFRTLTTIMEIFYDQCKSQFLTILNIIWNLLSHLKPYYLRNILLHHHHHLSYSLLQSSSNASIRRISSESSYKGMISQDNTLNLLNIPDNQNDSGYTSDGDRLDLETLLIQILDLLCVLWTVEDTQFKTHVTGDIQPLLKVITEFMRLPINMQEQYMYEPNDFIASEQDETFEFNLRCSGAELIMEMCTNTPKPSFLGVLELIQNEVTAFQQRGLQNIDDELWLEALMWVLGAMGREYLFLVNGQHHIGGKRKSTQSILNEIPQKNVLRLVISIVLPIIQSLDHFKSTYPIICGRSVWLYAIFSQLDDEDSSISSELRAACVRLMDSSWSLVVRLQSCRALADILNKQDKSNEGEASQKPLQHQHHQEFESNIKYSTFDGISKMDDHTFVREVISLSINLCSETVESTAHIPIETISMTLRCYQSQLHKYLSYEDMIRIISTAASLWTRFPSDPLCVEVTIDMCCEVTKISSGLGIHSFLNYFMMNPDILTSVYESIVTSEQAMAAYLHVLEFIYISLPNFVGNNHQNNNINNKNHSDDNLYRESNPNININIPEGLATTLHLLSHALQYILTRCNNNNNNNNNNNMTMNSPIRMSTEESSNDGDGISSTDATSGGGTPAGGFQAQHKDKSIVERAMSILLISIKTFNVVFSVTANIKVDIPSTLRLSLFPSLYHTVELGLLHHNYEDSFPVAAVGLLVHLFLNFGEVLQDNTAIPLLLQVVNIVRNSESSYVKRCSVMALIHLVSRDPSATCRLLGQVDVELKRQQLEQFQVNPSSNFSNQSDMNESALSTLLKEWKVIHSNFETSNTTAYSESVSTIGLMQLAGILGQYEGNNQIIAGQLLLTALHTLPRILVEGDDVTSDISDDTRDVHVDGHHESRFGDGHNLEGGAMGDDLEGSDDDEDGGSTDAQRTHGRYSRRAGRDPFAPAEEFLLSEVLNDVSGNNTNTEAGSPSCYIPEDLVFQPKRSDPLLEGGLQTKITNILKSLISSSGEPPLWMKRILTVQDMQLIQALVESDEVTSHS